MSTEGFINLKYPKLLGLQRCSDLIKTKKKSRPQDFWEWDQATNTWTQKANFGGLARNQAAGFSIGTKGYVGTGYNSASTYYQDFWEWDQATNTWTQKANFANSGPGRVFNNNL